MVPTSFTAEALLAFHGTMPERYRHAFDANAVREHAAIVARRRGPGPHVEIWRHLTRGGAVLCIVADDRPGLLSFISAALVACDLDVTSAQVYTRNVAQRTGRPTAGSPRQPSRVAKAEALDLLWVRRVADGSRGVLPADAAKVENVLQSLVLDRASIESVAKLAPPPLPPPPGSSTRVTFDENRDEELAVLTVETFDRPGILLAISLALFRAHVQIIASEATSIDERVVDRFTIVELDGRPIRAERRGRVQMEVLGAIDTLARGPGADAVTRAATPPSGPAAPRDSRGRSRKRSPSHR